MNLFISPCTDPYWNLAAEEILLKTSTENWLFLYVNKPCVVVGKHQTTQKEINPLYIYRNNVLVARRLSGGGAVYHDEGNLNFSYIRTMDHGENLSYQMITQSMVAFLTELVPEIRLSARNDLLLGENKISGSAMHVFKNRVLAHGTLLINCDLTHLSSALKGNPERFKDKSIASHRSPVMNLSQVNARLTPLLLITLFAEYLVKKEAMVQFTHLPSITQELISDLAVSRYQTSEWIYGYSPRYLYQNTVLAQTSKIAYQLEVEKGIIEDFIIVEGELNSDIKLLFNKLIGISHNIYALLEGPFMGPVNAAEQQLFQSLI